MEKNCMGILCKIAQRNTQCEWLCGCIRWSLWWMSYKLVSQFKSLWHICGTHWKKNFKKILHMKFLIFLYSSFDVYLETNCHMYECDYRWGLDWFGFIELFDTQLMTTLYNSLVYAYIHTHACTHMRHLHWPLLGSSFQWQMFPFLWFTNGPWPQLPASNSNNSQRLSLSIPLTDWLTNQPTN
jgi:hypothetical protein